MQTWILLLFFGTLGGALLGLLFWAGKKMRKIYYFETKNSFKSTWCFYRIKDGVFKQGKKRFILTKAPALSESHNIFGNVPVYFLQKGHPTPFHPLDTAATRKANVTPSELNDIMELSVLSQLLAGIKQDFRTVIIFMLIGSILGGLIVWAMITSGAISVPSGLCKAAVKQVVLP